ncbi:hypothetical protein [Permianibacter aggregans]|uniref:Uncharacterized protein n=1 Tax=Permianibacter aggregans TaxID=1510150 RepID=A0A4R6US00_9GAMM|nr:hypothetical protein [Permianibacter aggregans]QGX39451.1 hypothetical protein E2H98_07165 [Permianibacter aggregans]TDQ49812.1 hypothetical protein EV696_103184 [Permianibacter aggregans]
MKRILLACITLFAAFHLQANTGMSGNPFQVSGADQAEMNQLQLNPKLLSEYQKIKKLMFTEKDGVVPILDVLQKGGQDYPVLKSIDDTHLFFEQKGLFGIIKVNGMSTRQFAVIERTITYYQIWAKMMRDHMGMSLTPPKGNGEKNMKFVHDNLDQIIAFNTELWTSIGIDPDGEDETFDDQAPDDE